MDSMKAEIEGLKSEIRRMKKEPTASEREALAQIQMQADSLGRSLNIQITPPYAGESPDSYERRTVAKFQSFASTEKLKTMRLDSLPKDGFDFIKDQIYADASHAARNPGLAKGSGLYFETRNELGRQIMVPHGDSGSWIHPMTSPGYRLKGTFKTKFE